VIGSSLAIPWTATDEVDGVGDDDDEDGDEDDEDGDEDDEDCPTGRARMCCRSKPAGE
jgi:Ran GTPase-activating protein (RanGAP) involved in mRNA processing and transport